MQTRILPLLFKPLLKLVISLVFRVRVKGDTAAFNNDRLLVVANHQSFLDGLLLWLFLPINPVFIVHTWVSKHFLFRIMLKMVDHMAVDPANPMAIKHIVRAIESGRPVVIFPEGRITVTGNLMKVYDGPAFVAARTQATIVPVRINGAAYSYFSRTGGTYPRRAFPRITLSIQPATHIAMGEGATTRVRRLRTGVAMRRIMETMTFNTQSKQTLFEALLDAAALHGNKRPIIEDIKQEPYSYHTLIKTSLAFGRLSTRFSAPGENVGMLLPSLMPTVALFFGLNAFGRTPTMLNYSAGADDLKSACDTAQVKTIITSRAFIAQAKLEDKIAALSGRTLLYLEDFRKQITPADKLWLMGWALHFPRSVIAGQDPESPAAILFTSGSEGKPKGVVLSHRAILANINQIRAVIDISTDDRILNALPLFHSFGLTAGTLLPLIAGADAFIYPSPLHYRVIPELAYDRGCTAMFGTSTFLGNYARFANPYDFHRLRYVVAGAEKLAEPVRETWIEKFGIRILEGYGATETAPVIAVNTPMAYRKNTVGQVLPGIETRLAPVPGIDHGGELHIKGPNLMSGYLLADNPGVLQQPASELGAQWYNTGDIVHIDDDQFVHIVGRIKRFAKVAGEMVSLEAVEKLADRVNPEAQHASSSRPDASRGESIVLFTTDKTLNRELLLQAAKENGVTELAIPRAIIHIDAMPLIGSGKIDYVTLKQWAAEKAA